MYDGFSVFVILQSSKPMYINAYGGVDRSEYVIGFWHERTQTDHS